MADYTGQRFGDYLLIRFLGKGTFGDVYQGRHIRDNTLAAVKILHTRLTNSEDLKQFINEARTFRLKHPHIIQLLDFGIGEHDIPFLIMDYASNGTLRQRHPRGTRLPLALVVSYVKQIAAALQYAHDQKLIHRDVKPDNLLLGANNEILVSDFGIAVVVHSTRSLDTQNQAGTVPYMAPEQIQGKPRPVSDQYALGIVVYEWLSGSRPFQGSAIEIAMQHALAAPPSLCEKVPDVTPDVEQVIMTALAKDPKMRFTSVQAFANALEQASLPRKPPVGTRYGIYRGHTDNILTLRWSPNSRHIASATVGHIHIWDSTTGTRDYSLEGSNAIEWSPNGKYLVVRDIPHIKIWDVKEKAYVVTYKYGGLEHISEFAWSPNGEYLAFTGRNIPVEIYKFDTQDTNVLAHPHAAIDADGYSQWFLAWSPDGSRIATVEDHQGNGTEGDPSYHRASVLDIIASKHIIQSGYSDFERRVLTELYSHNGTVLIGKIAWSPDSSRLAWISASPENVVEICDASTDRLLSTYRLGSATRLTTFSPDWSRIASAEGPLVHLWDATTGKKLFTYQQHTSEVSHLEWSPDSSRLASIEASRVYIWQAN